MEHTEKSLEYLLRRVDGREWIPIYGLYQLIKDSIKKRPNIAEYWLKIFDDEEGFKESLITTFYALYQGVSSSLLVGGIDQIIKSI